MSLIPFQWNDASVRRALDLSGGEAGRVYGGISTDTRTLRGGDVFVALEGERFDGHDFLVEAVRAGCHAVIVRRDPGDLPVTVYRVPDTLVALGDLALYWRNQAQVPVVGITGSTGKTTVKDLTLGALSDTAGVHGTRGNQNNRIGTPLTILGMSAQTTALVLEMGTNEPGEIAELSRIARPTVSVVTTVSETHVERLGDLTGVLSEKLDLLRGMGGDGNAVVGDDPPVLAEEARRIHPSVAVSGLSERADPELRPVEARLREDGTYSFDWMGQPVSLRIPGLHGVYNALLALAVSRFLGVPEKSAASGVSGVAPGSMRGEVRGLGPITLVVDCYNSNLQSVQAAVRTLATMHSPGRRVVVLGSMLELGGRSELLHREALGRVLEADVDRVILSGDFARSSLAASDGRVVSIEDVEELVGRLPGLLEPGDTVLLKASRGVRLERAIPMLEAAYGRVGEA